MSSTQTDLLQSLYLTDQVVEHLRRVAEGAFE